MISFENVHFWYGEKGDNTTVTPVLRGISCCFREGEFVVLLGRNGSGKSTLAKHCNGLLLPKRGSVLVDGMDTRDASVLWEIRRRVGLVFQNPDNQLVATTVEEDVAFGPENLGLPPAEIRRRVDEALEKVGMTEYRKREPHTLSGGQKQRVAIAGVLAMRPKYLVLDEATAMLDPEGRVELLQLLQELRSEVGILHITHNVEEALLADRVFIIDEGSIVAEGPPREVFLIGKAIEQWGLELPQIVDVALLLWKDHPDLFRVLPLSPHELVDALCSYS
ncbi:MAG: energy-coupling factor transporter ATPase [Candidatus Caldatribacterium sp.]|uniref:energy-coupling factor transporter ATPase n=1 Tax=Candidatus Caldatribacterium sp. TaxID=2282143 RepID=UPI0029962103|nr:energy-coupling factor transporter ATPase [Candidatus Caldatribacterium sp.]MCX7729931.1 energy-coupling factor transporter ATPase [Candidatus Caldatribacterium sp.]MDW8082064.1 energy-coupling factor transporter ATPase [Candidatus Calescibacterium sp.]